MADDPGQIEFVSYHDTDDTSVYEYFGKHKEVVGDRDIGIFKMINYCQEIATGPIYMFTADDFYFETSGWDTAVEKTFERYDDKIVLVCPDGLFWNKWMFGCIGFVHRNWIDAVGYLLPPFDGSQAADQWMNELALAINRRVRLFDVRVSHTNCKDVVHMEKNKLGRDNQWRKRYWSPEMVEQRKNDIERLRKKCIQQQNIS